MKEARENIFTIFDDILKREDKEKLLNQKAKVIWMTGLSGSGKTTIAQEILKLYKKHLPNLINIDGDIVRHFFEQFYKILLL